VVLLCLAQAPVPAASPASTSAPEALLSVDLRDAPVADVLRLVAELTGQQLVLDGGVTCRLTLRLSGVRWETALEHSLRACGLASDMDEGVLRVAPAQRLLEERRQQRALQDAQRRASPAGPIRVPLSYARAEELAPLLQKLLGPGCEVAWDRRTNTLFVVGRPQ
jgi:type IV pilus assembly protein PilQ